MNAFPIIALEAFGTELEEPRLETKCLGRLQGRRLDAIMDWYRWHAASYSFSEKQVMRSSEIRIA